MSRDAVPGSPYAIAIGCTCPVLDNAGGKGCGVSDQDGSPLYWINEFCPLHSRGMVELVRELEASDDE